MKTESVVQSEIRADAGSLGVHLWRNNRGAMEDPTNGRIVRFGLGNDSPQMDRRLKSSDLIGITPPGFSYGVASAVTPGRFIAVECKAEGFRFPDAWRGMTPDQVEKTRAPADAALRRTLAQWRFLKIVHDARGFAGFAQSVADFRRILTGELVLP